MCAADDTNCELERARELLSLGRLACQSEYCAVGYNPTAEQKIFVCIKNGTTNIDGTEEHRTRTHAAETFLGES